jgi:phosphatidylinositol alpha-mannosyltransferase
MTALRVALAYDDTIDRHGGIGLYVLTLGAALQRRGHHVEYLLGNSVVTHAEGGQVHSLARNVQVRFNGNLLSMPAWSDGRRIDRVVDAGRYDVLHVQMPYSPVMSGRVVRRVAERCAVIGTYHVASERLLPRGGALLLRMLRAQSVLRFDEIISVSRTAADFAERWSRIEAPRVIPNLLDVPAVRAQAALPGRVIADVVFVGRLVPRKGAKELITAVAHLHRRAGHACTTVAIVGDGPLRQALEGHAQRLGVDAAVTFYGALSDKQKFAALAQARIACFPSLFGESFGVVVLEALAAGADAVLAGRNPGYAELLDDPSALVDPHDAPVFAARLAELLEDHTGRHALGQRQRELLTRCDADVVVDSVLDVYERALRRRPGGTAVMQLTDGDRVAA